jgi:hypothetical protein
MFSDPEIAWAAGFFEGEGRITHGAARIVVRVNNTDPEPIYRFAEIVCYGEVYGPYDNGPRRKPFWVWMARDFDALEVLEMMWPWLSARRRRRALELAPLDAIHLPVDQE